MESGLQEDFLFENIRVPVVPMDGMSKVPYHQTTNLIVLDDLYIILPTPSGVASYVSFSSPQNPQSLLNERVMASHSSP